ncbi:MAG: ATP-binding protein [bacterium]
MTQLPSTGINLEEILLLVVIVSNLAIGIFVFLRKPKNIIHQSFSLAVTGISFWSFGLVLTETQHHIERYTTLSLFGFLVLLSGFLLFAKTFPYGKIPHKSFFLHFIPIIFLAVLAPFNLIITKTDLLPTHPSTPTNGPLFPVFALVSLFVIVESIVLSVRSYLRSSGKARLQMNYLLFGLSVFLLSAGIFDILLPSVGFFELTFLGPISSIFYIGLTAYAIIRHELLDIRIVIQRSLIYTIVLILIVTVYLLLIVLFGLILGTTTDTSSIVSAGATTILGIGGLPIIQTYFERWSDSIFFKCPYNYAEVMHSLSRILHTNHEKNEIVAGATRILQETFKTNNVCFLFDTDIFTQTYPEARVAGFRNAYQPIMFEKSSIGVLTLGPKKSGDFYTQKDAQFLATFAVQAAIALTKAELYARVQNYSAHLERLVAERTDEIQKLQEEQKEAMITISHNLQTPLAIIRGELEILSDHSENPTQLLAVQKSIDRVSGFIRQLLRVVRFEHSLDQHEMTPIALKPLLQEQIDYFEVVAEDKHITLITDIADCGSILGNKKLLEELVTNIVANAMHYRSPLRDGHVTITLKKSGHLALLTISDNGAGISADDLPHIFDRFYRAPQNPASHTGSGLGLAIAKQIVTRHNGCIRVTSTLHEGTTFSIQFPILSQ